MNTLWHSILRSVGWHLGTALFNLAGPIAIVAAILTAVTGVALWARHRRRITNNTNPKGRS